MALFKDFGFSAEKTSGSAVSSGEQVKQRILTPEAQQKLIYDLLSQDAGLAQLLSTEGLMGGRGSSTKTLMAQDFMAKALGELALITAPEVSTASESTSTSSKKGGIAGKTVICTELMRQGRLPTDLYEAGYSHFQSLSPYTIAGYRLWANKVAARMRTSALLSRIMTPVAVSRYEMTTGRKRFTVLGAITIYIGQPICYLIGRACYGPEIVREVAYGD